MCIPLFNHFHEAYINLSINYRGVTKSPPDTGLNRGICLYVIKYLPGVTTLSMSAFNWNKKPLRGIETH